jgi:hypothetical protein
MKSYKEFGLLLNGTFSLLYSTVCKAIIATSCGATSITVHIYKHQHSFIASLLRQDCYTFLCLTIPLNYVLIMMYAF